MNGGDLRRCAAPQSCNLSFTRQGIDQQANALPFSCRLVHFGGTLACVGATYFVP